MSKKVNPYKQETIDKIREQLKAEMDKFRAMDIADIALAISKGNQKIGKVMNVSLAPLYTCGNCGKCQYFCYDIKACLQYANVRSARARNTVLALRDMTEYFRRIDVAISRRRVNKYFRWHVSGDIINREYFRHMIELAVKHPDFTFWTYTKMYWLVNQYCADNGGREAIPENLHIMFSEWDGVPMPNPYGFPEFSCKFPEGNINHQPEYFEHIHKCPGNCDVCKALHRGCVAGETSYADLH